MSKVYVAHAPLTGLVKIGRARTPAWRVKDMMCASGFRIELVHIVECGERARDVEKAVHAHLAEHRSVGEWFAVPVQIAIDTVHLADGSIASPSPRTVAQHAGFQLVSRVSGETLCKLDDLRRAAPDFPTRAEMIRRLIDQAPQASPPHHSTVNPSS